MSGQRLGLHELYSEEVIACGKDAGTNNLQVSGRLGRGEEGVGAKRKGRARVESIQGFKG